MSDWQYILKDKSKSSNRKDKSTFTVVPRHEDQLGTSSGKEVFDNEIGTFLRLFFLSFCLCLNRGCLSEMQVVPQLFEHKCHKENGIY